MITAKIVGKSKLQELYQYILVSFMYNDDVIHEESFGWHEEDTEDSILARINNVKIKLEENLKKTEENPMAIRLSDFVSKYKDEIMKSDK